MRRGFTLIEVVVALAVLAMGTTLLVAAGTRCLERLGTSRQMQTGGVAAQRKLASLVQAGPPRTEEETDWALLEASTDLDVQASWRKRVVLVPVAQEPGTSPDPATSLRLLEVSVRLGDDPRAPVFRLATLFPPPPPPP